MPTTPGTPGPADPPPPGTEPGDTPDYDETGVPTFGSVRAKIENRYATAQGTAELDADSSDRQSVTDQYEERRRAAAERLAQIRESMPTDE